MMVAAAIVAIVDGRPDKLPAVALGSSSLFVVLKAFAFFSIALLALVVLVRAFSGQLPSEVRGIKWEQLRDAKDETEIALEALNGAVEQLRVRLDLVEKLQGIDDEE